MTHTSKLVSLLFPRQITVTHRERLLSGVTGLLAILLTTWVTRHFVGTAPLPFILASMGASAVLLLGTPHSPLSQPWPFVGGHLISALIGITCAMLIPNMYLAAGLAVGLSIVAMYYLRCLHPPGGATALLAVIGDQRIHALGYHLITAPILVNVVIMLSLALFLNNLIPGRRYPIALSLPGKQDAADQTVRPKVKLNFSEDDLLAALRDMNGYIDVTGEDLEKIYSLATLHAHRRQLGDIRLKDIMTRDVITVRSDTGLEKLWKILRFHRIRGVPVVGEDGKVVGMVSITDFVKMANWRMCLGLVERIKLLLKWTAEPTAGQIMSYPAITARDTMPMTDAFLIFAEKGINHLPVVDKDYRPIGIVTRLDLLSALYGDLAVAAAA
jgi:CBS domain-containing membrane protein